MDIQSGNILLVTGGTGLVGSHVLEAAWARGLKTRALVRSAADAQMLSSWGCELVEGDLAKPESVKQAVEGATIIVHCAAKVGDWGPVDGYREVNVGGLKNLVTACQAFGQLNRFVHISSLGVYPARDHHGTDESEPINAVGIDGYTLTKVEAELYLKTQIEKLGFPAVILRPGFIYGPRDRTVLPRIFERLRKQKFAFLGTGENLMNNTFVGNLVEAIFLSIERDECLGQCFNITDGRLVSKKEFISTIAEQAEYPQPTKHVPLPVARFLAKAMEGTWKLLGKKEAPLLSNARIKFLGLNLDYSIEKAKRELRYAPHVDFQEGMKQTIDWFRDQDKL
ncbi:MAG: NAD-dependent epimerase/dehydratase family protein [Planctomycetaceae bacterium]|nr:NAD-dependent epimerase/dehydratase family protein [Planctomycetaceae bacterium]